MTSEKLTNIRYWRDITIYFAIGSLVGPVFGIVAATLVISVITVFVGIDHWRSTRRVWGILAIPKTHGGRAGWFCYIPHGRAGLIDSQSITEDEAAAWLREHETDDREFTFIARKRN